jgi:Ni/Fe-hydrogenase subunit HybB-like protein
MGYAVVVFESALSAGVLGRRRETPMLASLAGVMVPVLAVFTLVRFVDLGLRGRLGLLGTFDLYTGMFLVETVLFLAPAFMLLSPKARNDAGNLFRASMVMILAGSVYRLDAYIVAFRPGERFAYFPSFAELMVTLGVVALEVILYVVIVKYFPILSAPGAEAPARTARA